MNGTISKVISDKGFGFIQGEDGQRDMGVLRIIPPDLPQAVAAPRRGSTASRSTTSSEQHVQLDRVQPRTLSAPLAGCPPPTRCLFARVAHYSTLVVKGLPSAARVRTLKRYRS